MNMHKSSKSAMKLKLVLLGNDEWNGWFNAFINISYADLKVSENENFCAKKLMLE